MICKTAIIKDTEVGKNTSIYNYVNIYGSKIGSNCKIGSFVEIQNNTKIGNNVIISSHSFICSLVEIKNNVFIGHGIVTINDLHPPSFKKTGKTNQWKKTLINNNVTIGSNVTLFPVVIGEDAEIGAGSVVTKDVPRGAIVVGNPAKIIRMKYEH